MVPVQNLITGDFMEPPPTLYCSSSPDFIHIRQKEPILLKSLLSVVRGKLGRGAILLQMYDVHISSLSGRFNTILVPSCFFFQLLLMLLMMFPDLQVLKFFSTCLFFPSVSPFCLLLVSFHLTFLKKDTVSVSGSKLLKKTRNINS